jgi:pimeloyl-ACP methyl ester carboxylesterase
MARADPRGGPEATIVTTVSMDGTPIGCWRSGQGPPVVLVHGGTNDHTSWDPLLPALALHFTVYAMDRRGRGASGDLPAYAIEREYEDVAAVVDHLGVPVYLVGHSYGALCALEAARLTPNVAKLVLYEAPVAQSSARLPPGFIAELEGLVAAGRREETLTRFFQVVLARSAEEIARLRADARWATRVAAAHTVARETRIAELYRFEPTRFRDVAMPTLLLQGGESPPFLKRSTEAVHAALPNSRLVVLPGQGHNALTTAPELVSAEVLHFLR